MNISKGFARPKPGGQGSKRQHRVPESSASGTDSTIIRPRPGGNKRDTGFAANDGSDDNTIIRPRRKKRRAAMALNKVTGFGNNILVDSSTTLLSLVPQLRSLEGNIDVASLHQQVMQQVQNFSRKLEKENIQPDVAKKSRYVLCALIDETVLNTAWGEHSIWSQKSMLSVFHHETYGGEKFFNIVDETLNASRKDYQLLELLYLCLSLGFMGRLRIDPQGSVKCEQVRSDVYHVLHNGLDNYKNELSINVDTANTIRQRLHSLLPVWVYTVLLALAAFGIFTYLLMNLNESTDQLQGELAALTPAPVEQVLSIARVRPEVIRLRELLAPEIEREIVRVDDYGSRISVVIQAQELFGSGSTEINTAFYPRLDKISKALEAIDDPGRGRIVVSGHTDNIAIRTTRYPSNWHLSLARASAVVKYMSVSANLKGRLLPEGRADTEPVADNKTPAGRAKNRRVAIDISYIDKI